MNNKGFTLVELLAVLVILVTILLIAIPSITSSVERNKEKLTAEKIKIIESSAREYANKYKNNFNYISFTNTECCIDILDIKNIGLLDENDLKDANKSNISGYICYVNNDYVYTNENKTSCGVN